MFYNKFEILVVLDKLCNIFKILVESIYFLNFFGYFIKGLVLILMKFVYFIVDDLFNDSFVYNVL